MNEGADSTEEGGEPATSAGARDTGYGPAREMSLHLLRMLETRIEAAGIALQAEAARLMSRLQLQLLAAAAFFIAIWGGIVLRCHRIFGYRCCPGWLRLSSLAPCGRCCGRGAWCPVARWDR